MAVNGCVAFSLVLLIVLVFAPSTVRCHGYMLEPPSRMSAWKLGLSSYVNYNHMEMWCGGRSVQHNDVNVGRCGVCGDQWSLSPRPHEFPAIGQRGYSRVDKVYAKGQMIDVVIVLTANHYGHFLFKLCDVSTVQGGVEATNECLDKTPLLVGGCQDRYTLQSSGSRCNGVYTIKVKLPDDVTCQRCLLQWRYITAHNPNPQEQFVACADIVIRDDVSVTSALSEGRVTRGASNPDFSTRCNNVNHTLCAPATATPRPPTAAATTTTARPQTSPTTTTTPRPTTTTSTTTPAPTTTTPRPTTTTSTTTPAPTTTTPRPTTTTTTTTPTPTTATSTTTPRPTTTTTTSSTLGPSPTTTTATTTPAPVPTTVAPGGGVDPCDTDLCFVYCELGWLVSKEQCKRCEHCSY